MVKLNWTDQAIENLNNIAEYIARDSFKYSKIQILRIRKKAQQLKVFPLSGRIVPELNNPDMRELILGNFRIIYKIVAKQRIDILTIHHSAMLLNESQIGNN